MTLPMMPTTPSSAMASLAALKALKALILIGSLMAVWRAALNPFAMEEFKLNMIQLDLNV